MEQKYTEEELSFLNEVRKENPLFEVLEESLSILLEHKEEKIDLNFEELEKYFSSNDPITSFDGHILRRIAEVIEIEKDRAIKHFLEVSQKL